MYSKVLCLLGLLAVGMANLVPEYEKAVSSQYIIKKDDHPVGINRDYYNDYYRNNYHYGHGYNHYDYYAYPKYEFEYKVADPHTGDFKKQRELRDGGLVKGFYELLQPDGHERRVDYYSDDKIGFQADVKYNINHRYPYAKYYRPYPDHYPRYYH
ncbi:unnamed protein product [Danaus chrysippus]|uniref:(African queen) hypothetical protein n=1 Tax=Danaus chrysippus TaxID=151541 RepID=A0A8J2QE11_9NEOP|nr:unnamed protein product [Danaus chrysippus]